MSLAVRVYTFDEDGQRQTVRGIDLMKFQKEWQAQLIRNVALFAAIPPPLVRAMKEERDEILARFANIADAMNEAIELGGGGGNRISGSDRNDSGSSDEFGRVNEFTRYLGPVQGTVERPRIYASGNLLPCPLDKPTRSE